MESCLLKWVRTLYSGYIYFFLLLTSAFVIAGVFKPKFLGRGLFELVNL